MFKSGIFFIALEDDAKKLSKLFNFKLTNLSPTVVKCGFPCSSYEKYLKVFSDYNLHTKVIELNTLIPYQIDNNVNSPTVNNILNKISFIDINNLSIKDAFNLIEELQNALKNNY